jgi:hypothetical protein
MHRGTCCQAVVDQNNAPSSKLRVRPVALEGSLTPRKLPDFFSCHGV